MQTVTHFGQGRTMASSTPKHPEAARLGEWLMQRRLRAGFNRPELVKRAQLSRPDANISQDYLSKLEYGTRSLTTASPAVREALRLALGIREDEWESVTGLEVTVPPAPIPTPTARVETLLSSLLNAAQPTVPLYDLGAAPHPLTPEGSMRGVNVVMDPVARRDGAVMFLMRGGSMTPLIQPSAVLYVDTADREVRDGDVYVVHDGRYAVRRARLLGDQMWYFPDAQAPDAAPMPSRGVSVVGCVYLVHNPPVSPRLH